MKAENIMSDSIVPPSEEEANGLVVQRLSVSIQLKFADLISWLNRIESNKPLLRVTSIELAKRDDPLGANTVTVQLSTIIPTKKAGGM
jgi:type II secretory pathway component PulM